MKKLFFTSLLCLMCITGLHSQPKGCLIRNMGKPNNFKDFATIGQDLLAYDFISIDDIYYIERDYFDNYIENFWKKDSINNAPYNIFSQIIYYDWEDNMISFNSIRLVYYEPATDSTEVKFYWNSSEMYNTFPPTDLYSSPGGKLTDYTDENSPYYLPKINLSRDSIVKYMKPIYENVEISDEEIYDYEVFIFTNLFHLSYEPYAHIETVKENLKLKKGASVKVNIVMTDLASPVIPPDKNRKKQIINRLKKMVY